MLARAFDRILKDARTIAEMAGAERIATPHLRKRFNTAASTATPPY